MMRNKIRNDDNDVQKETLTWKQIVELEPRVLALYKEIQTVKDDATESSFCANSRWYGHGVRDGFKARFVYLVGWTARHPRWRTMQAYDLAYDKLYRALADCRNCWCM